MDRLPKQWSQSLRGRRWLFVVGLIGAVGGLAQVPAQAQSGKPPPPASGTAPAPSTTGGAGPADPALAKTLCGLLKKVNARAGTDPGVLRLDLVMASGKAVDYDPAKVRAIKTEIDKLTSAQCPLERELALANLQVKSLAQAIK